MLSTEVFKMAIQIFSQSWKTFDSYGEALVLNNNETEAVKMYQKSVEFNPENENGKKVLKSY